MFSFSAPSSAPSFSFGTFGSSNSGFSFGGQGQTGSMSALGTGMGMGTGTGMGMSGMGNTATQSAAITTIAPTTKFTDLATSYQQVMTEIETKIMTSAKHRTAIEEFIRTQPTHVRDLRIDTHTLNHRAQMVMAQINSQIVELEMLFAAVAREVRQTESAVDTAGRMTEAQKTDTNTLPEQVYLPSQFHWEKMSNFTTRLADVEAMVEQLTEFLNYQSSTHNQRLLDTVLHSEHAAVISVVSRIAKLHEAADNVRENAQRAWGRTADELFSVSTKTNAVFDKLLDPLNTSNDTIQINASMSTAAPGTNTSSFGTSATTNSAPMMSSTGAATSTATISTQAPLGFGTHGFSGANPTRNSNEFSATGNTFGASASNSATSQSAIGFGTSNKRTGGGLANRNRKR